VTQQETVNNIVREVMERVDQYDDGRLTRQHVAEGVRSIVSDYVQKFFDSNSIDIQEVGLFDEDDEDGEYIDDDEEGDIDNA